MRRLALALSAAALLSGCEDLMAMGGSVPAGAAPHSAMDPAAVSSAGTVLPLFLVVVLLTLGLTLDGDNGQHYHYPH